MSRQTVSRFFLALAVSANLEQSAISLASQSSQQVGVVNTSSGSASVVPPGWQDANLSPSEVELVAYKYKGQSTQIILPKNNQGGAAASMFLPPYGVATGTDADNDGIVDANEDKLAEQFAPIIIHDKDDLNLPANVDWILTRASLEYYNNNGLLHKDDHQHVGGPPLTQQSLLGKIGKGAGGNPTIHSDGTRSRNRRHTFAILDVQSDDRRGSLDSKEWTTYVHAFRNYYGGVTLQYWRCYAYNTGDQAASPPIQIDHHGGDWETVQVVLNKELVPVSFRFFSHTGIEVRTPQQVQLEKTHVKVYSEPGGHASHALCDVQETLTILGISFHIWLNDLNSTTNIIRQETWLGGRVTWPTDNWRSHPGGISAASGGLLNMGEKTAPLNSQVFVRYSGLWGSLGTNFSGYWGPAYNETLMGPDGFVTAWAYGMKASKGNIETLRNECYPAEVSE